MWFEPCKWSSVWYAARPATGQLPTASVQRRPQRRERAGEESKTEKRLAKHYSLYSIFLPRWPGVSYEL